jgi:ribosomal protein S10
MKWNKCQTSTMVIVRRQPDNARTPKEGHAMITHVRLVAVYMRESFLLQALIYRSAWKANSPNSRS